MEDLARVVDPRALDLSSGTSARMEVRVPSAWGGRTIAITAPSRVTCARCDGGGCDGCARRGGFRLACDAVARTFSATLPRDLSTGVSLRLSSPFEAEVTIELLRVDVLVAEAASPEVRLVETTAARRPRSPIAVGVAIAAGIAALVLAALMSR